MKSIIPIVIATALTLTAFSNESLNENLRPAEATARGLVTALRQSSEERFVSMFPKLAEFHEMMDANEAFYGLNLEAAKEDFAKTYTNELMPAVRRAFANLIAEGEKRGIKWSYVNVVSVDIPEASTGFASITVTFEQDGKPFDLIIERSLMIDGKWKVSQYVKFM
jgi:hypothetical protein